MSSLRGGRLRAGCVPRPWACQLLDTRAQLPAARRRLCVSPVFTPSPTASSPPSPTATPTFHGPPRGLSLCATALCLSLSLSLLPVVLCFSFFVFSRFFSRYFFKSVCLQPTPIPLVRHLFRFFPASLVLSFDSLPASLPRMIPFYTRYHCRPPFIEISLPPAQSGSPKHRPGHCFWCILVTGLCRCRYAASGPQSWASRLGPFGPCWPCSVTAKVPRSGPFGDSSFPNSLTFDFERGLSSGHTVQLRLSYTSCAYAVFVCTRLNLPSSPAVSGSCHLPNLLPCCHLPGRRDQRRMLHSHDISIGRIFVLRTPCSGRDPHSLTCQNPPGKRFRTRSQQQPARRGWR